MDSNGKWNLGIKGVLNDNQKFRSSPRNYREMCRLQQKIYAINQTEISLLRKITQLQAEIIEEYKKQEMENLHQKE